MPAPADQRYDYASNEPDNNGNASNERESNDVGNLRLGRTRWQLSHCVSIFSYCHTLGSAVLAIRLSMPVADIPNLLYRMQHEAKGKVAQNVLGNDQGQLITSVCCAESMKMKLSEMLRKFAKINISDVFSTRLLSF